MSALDQVNEISNLKSEWDLAQPLSEQNEKRLWEKFRLEWNYNSNHIEGNTLTYGETALLLVHDRASGNHDLRELEEMKAHDVAITYVYKLAKDSRPLTESDIRDLNRITLKEPFFKEAETPDGKQTHKEIIPGKYKESPNNVRTASGTIFEFAAPVDVPHKMAGFIQYFNQSIEDTVTPLPLLLAKIHHDFVLIHPFDDGNGRTARLIVNYFLLRRKLLPIVIKSSNKKTYLEALQKADVGDISAFTNFLEAEIIWSLQLGIRASKGESLEELSDIDKEISLFSKSILANERSSAVKRKDAQSIRDLYQINWRPLFIRLIEKMEPLRKLFDMEEVLVYPMLALSAEEWIGKLDAVFADINPTNTNQVLVQVKLDGYKGPATSPFTIDQLTHVAFSEYNYTFSSDHAYNIKKLYSELISTEEGDLLIQDTLKRMFSKIKRESTAA